VVGCVWF